MGALYATARRGCKGILSGNAPGTGSGDIPVADLHMRRRRTIRGKAAAERVRHAMRPQNLRTSGAGVDGDRNVAAPRAMAARARLADVLIAEHCADASVRGSWQPK